MKELQNNDALLNKLNADNYNQKFMMIPNETGDQMNAYIMKPEKILTQIKISTFHVPIFWPGSQSSF